MPTVYTILPTENIRDCDIRATLNANGGKCSNVWGTRLTKGAINGFARFKPVPSKVREYSLSEWQSSGYKGYNGQCGLDIPYYTTPANLRAALVSGEALWNYEPPMGDPYYIREGDWRMYYPGAVNPIGSMAPSYILRNTTTGYEFDIEVEVQVSSSNSDYNLTLGDLSVNGINLSDMYMGVYMVPESGSGYYFQTADTPVGDEGMSITLKGDSGTTGKYTAYLFLASLPQTGTEQAATFVGLNKRGMQITIKSADTLHDMTGHALWLDDASFQYEVQIKNGNATATTYKDVTLYMVRATDADGNPNYDGLFDESVREIVQSWTLAASLTVPAGTTDTSLQGTLTRRRQSSYAYGVFVATTSPKITGEIWPMDEAVAEASVLTQLLTL